MGTPAAASGRLAGGIHRVPLSKSKRFHPVFFKLGEYVGGHTISTKFYNLPNPPLLNYGP